MANKDMLNSLEDLAVQKFAFAVSKWEEQDLNEHLTPQGRILLLGTLYGENFDFHDPRLRQCFARYAGRWLQGYELLGDADASEFADPESTWPGEVKSIVESTPRFGWDLMQSYTAPVYLSPNAKEENCRNASQFDFHSIKEGSASLQWFCSDCLDTFTLDIREWAKHKVLIGSEAPQMVQGSDETA